MNRMIQVWRGQVDLQSNLTQNLSRFKLIEFWFSLLYSVWRFVEWYKISMNIWLSFWILKYFLSLRKEIKLIRIFFVFKSISNVVLYSKLLMMLIDFFLKISLHLISKFFIKGYKTNSWYKRKKIFSLISKLILFFRLMTLT